MKLIINSIITIFMLYMHSYNAYGQSESNNSQQNPRYKESESKYIKSIDSLTKNQSITVQQTYKAFDWYENKMEIKAKKDLWRHLERMKRAKNGTIYYNDGWWPPSYYSSPWLNPNPYINYRGSNWGFGIIF